MNKLGLTIGIIAFIALLIGYIPCLGWTFWVTLPVAFIGTILCIVGLTSSDSYASQTKNLAVIGLVLNLITLAFGFIRWVAGGFIL